MGEHAALDSKSTKQTPADLLALRYPEVGSSKFALSEARKTLETPRSVSCGTPATPHPILTSIHG